MLIKNLLKNEEFKTRITILFNSDYNLNCHIEFEEDNIIITGCENTSDLGCEVSKIVKPTKNIRWECKSMGFTPVGFVFKLCIPPFGQFTEGMCKYMADIYNGALFKSMEEVVQKFKVDMVETLQRDIKKTKTTKVENIEGD